MTTALETRALETDVPIIDSHIHLYPSSEISTLAWCGPGNPICHQHSLTEYAAGTKSHPSIEGFIFVETDRIHDLEKGIEDGSGWKYPLMEVDWLRRIATGTPKPGEGHEAHHKKLCLAIVPWAPLPSGVEALERYVEMVRERAGESWLKIRGFRYLVQDKKEGTMLGEGFIEGLKWLGRKGFAFDVGVDHHRGGDWQLDEAAQMIRRAHEGVAEGDKVTFILSRLLCLHFTPIVLTSMWSQTIYANRT
jgi:L-rhamnono-1,4-lactonase